MEVLPCSYNKANERHKFLKFIFWNRTLHVSDRFIVRHQESGTVYTAIGICHIETLKMGKITNVCTCTS